MNEMMNNKNSSTEIKSLNESRKSNASTNINEPPPDRDNYTNENNRKLSFPLIEIETADTFWNSGNGNRPQASLCDLEVHQHHLSNLFDSSISAFFDESEIDIESASFASDISALAFSTSNISSCQSPTSNQRGQKKRNRYFDKDLSKTGRRKKKGKNKFSSEDDFPFNSSDNFFDYFQSYKNSFMPAVLSKRWNKKTLQLRKDVICAYRAEDTRTTSVEYEKIDQKLREEEDMRRERIANFASFHKCENSSPVYDNQDKELEINQKQLQISRSHDLSHNDNQNTFGQQNIEERERKLDDFTIESIDSSLDISKNISPLLILSLAIRFLFFIGHLLNLC